MLWPDTRISLIGRLADPQDGRAWEEFERSYQSAIYRYVRGKGLQNEDARDAVQEVMVVVHQQAAKWVPSGRVGSFRAWLVETARRVTLQQLRLRKHAGVGGTTLVHRLNGVQAEGDSNEAAEVDEKRWQFCCAAGVVESMVDPQHWKAFWLTAVEGESAEWVAQHLRIRLGTVYSIRCRVQAKIRDQIQAMHNEQKGSEQ